MARSITTFQNCSHSMRRAESSLADHAFGQDLSFIVVPSVPDLVDASVPGSIRSNSRHEARRRRERGDGESDPLSAVTVFGSQVSTIRILIICLPISLRSSHDLLCKAHSPGSETSCLRNTDHFTE